MDGNSGSGKPGQESLFSFKSLRKSTTIRVLLPCVLLAHFGWYYVRNQVTLDEKRGIYVIKHSSDQKE